MDLNFLMSIIISKILFDIDNSRRYGGKSEDMVGTFWGNYLTFFFSTVLSFGNYNWQYAVFTRKKIMDISY